MTLAIQAVRGAAWTIGVSMGTRALGIVGTLVITRFLLPEVVGEVAVATVLVMTANQLSILGFGQYVIARQDLDRAGIFHATAYNVVFATLVLGLLLGVGGLLAPLFNAPEMTRYLPGMVAAAFLQRIGFMPARVLARQMRFRVASVGQGAGELAYAVSSVWLAAAGLGGMAIVWGNIARALVSTVIYLVAVDTQDWCSPCRLTRQRSLDLFRFGVPISIAALASVASRRWDNLLFAGLFGPATMGLYNLAYNLADLPATHVGEHIGDVLLPSFARLEKEKRGQGLLKVMPLLALVVFPLAVGLGPVAPTLIRALLPAEWHGVAPFLVILASLSLVRPIGWAVAAYMQARNLVRGVMWLEIAKVVFLLGCVWLLGQLGPLWAAGGVGVAFGLHALASLWLVEHHGDIPSITSALAGLAGPLFACGPMVAAVLAARWLLLHNGASPIASLLVEILAGAAAYVLAAFAVAPRTSRHFVQLVRRSLSRVAA